MYTIVVMAALGTSADVPDCGHRRRGDCGGCCGGCYGGCWGGCYGGCWGGCHGGCYGGCCGGCYGGSWGGRGYARGNYSPSVYAYSGYSTPVMMSSNYTTPSMTPMPATSGTSSNGVRQAGYDGGTNTFRDITGQGMESTAPATLVINVPTNARLTIEGQPVASMAMERILVSPPLQRGKTFVYNLKAQIERPGGPVTTTREVEVRAGETSRVTLTIPSSQSAE